MFVANVQSFDDVRRALQKLDWVPWRAYTVTWTASGGTPAIGNGTLVGYYTTIAGICIASLTMTAGSTTTFGPGTFAFSLPIAMVTGGRVIGSCRVFDSSTGIFYVCAASVESAGTTLAAVQDGAGVVSNVVPMVAGWATSDVFDATVIYPIAGV